MNYLAHAALAEASPHSLIGNLSGDHVKGPLERHALHPQIANGVRRHRRVDGLTDRHPQFALLREHFPASHRRFAGIVLDVLFDHFLSTEWECLCGRNRDEFIDSVYAVLSANHELIPSPFDELAPRWVAADWLRVYHTLDGVDAVMSRLATRLRRGDALLATWHAVADDTPALREGFRAIFTDVRDGLDGSATARPRPFRAPHDIGRNDDTDS